jgi:hypothetical protein
MVQVHTCVSVRCDQCGLPLGSPNYETHYPTEDAALDAAESAGWVCGPGGQWWCSCCGPVLICDAEGHEFTPWKPAPVTGELRWVGRKYRYCRRCCLHESRTPHPRDVTLPAGVTVPDVAAHRSGLSQETAPAPTAAGDASGEVA